MEDFTKILNPFKQELTGNGRFYNVFVKVTYRDGKLSISGVQNPYHSGNCMGSCGQIDMEYWHADESQSDTRWNHLIKPEELKFKKGWGEAEWLNLLNVWNKYHLNDWHKVEIPEDILDWLKSLPETEVEPAWV